MAKIYDYKALGNKGLEIDFAQFEGKVLLIVNTASKCGFTPQYDGLEALYQKYKDRGLVIVGFPCDQFAHQEPGSDEEIAEFCRINHGVTFPLMKKIDVNGPEESPVFTYLKSAAPSEEYKGFKAKATQKLLKGLSKSVEKGERKTHKRKDTHNENQDRQRKWLQVQRTAYLRKSRGRHPPSA